MDRKEIEELIRLVEDSDVQELHIRSFLTSVKIVKAQTHGQGTQALATDPPLTAVTEPPPATAAAHVDAVEDAPAAPADADAGLVPISSPMVGTFYAASSPEAAPYVKQGDHVNKGQVVGVVEAMKLMNEIESEVAGTIVRIVAENAHPVEFGSPLFMVQPD